MKIVMTRDDVKNILIRYIFTNYAQAIGINSPDEIQFNSDALPYYFTDLQDAVHGFLHMRKLYDIDRELKKRC